MELKRILANDAKTANDRAMALYGRDVLVISNHTVGGQTELIVALDIDEQGPDPTVQIAGKSSASRDPLLSFSSQMALAQNKARPSALAPVKLEPAAPPAGAEFVPANLASLALDAPFDREVIEQILDELKALRREVSLSQKPRVGTAALIWRLRSTACCRPSPRRACPAGCAPCCLTP